MRRFNPLPPPKRGETTDRAVDQLRQDSGFNPLPPPKRGETPRFAYELPPIRKFQSTPPAEARGDDLHQLVMVNVSIHSPRRSEGRLRMSLLYLRDYRRSQFQSTPPAEARGDVLYCVTDQAECIDKVSIHSPRRSEGRRGRPAID